MLNNQIDAVKVLLEHGANIEDRARDGSTTLNMAIINAYYDMASVLLDHGANPNIAGSERNAAALGDVDAQARHVLGSGSHGQRSDSRCLVRAAENDGSRNSPRSCWRRARIRTPASPGKKCG